MNRLQENGSFHDSGLLSVGTWRIGRFAVLLAVVSGCCTAAVSTRSWHFGSAAGRDGDGGFVLGNTSATNGVWSVEPRSLRFRNAYVADNSDQNNYTEAAAVTTLEQLGVRQGQDFTLSLRFSLQGVRDWNRVGIIAFAPDMRDHVYRDASFYHAQLRVHGGAGCELRVGKGFAAERPLANLPLPLSPRDGVYELELVGKYDDSQPRFRVELRQEGDEAVWIHETEAIADVLDQAWFGFGGRFKAYGDTYQPVIDFHRFTVAAEAASRPLPDGETLSFSGTWDHGGLAHHCSVRVHRSAHRYRALPTAVYLRNLEVSAGTGAADDAMVTELLDDGLAVVELDCAGLSGPDRSPRQSIMAFNQVITRAIARLSGGVIVPDENHLYWVPAGYRLERNLPFWNIQRHGAPGTLEHIVKVFNERVVPRAGAMPVRSPDQLRGPRGAPLDYNLYLDIVYPADRSADTVSAIAHFSTQCRRPRAFRGERAIYPITWVTSGYALVYVDHVYNPLSRSSTYGFLKGAYSLQNSNGLAAGSAAIRFLRAHASRYHLNGRIGALGHSKSSYTVIRLADPRHAGQNEYSAFQGDYGNVPEPRPWPGYSSEIAVAYASMGDGTRRTKLFNSRMVPLLTACGRHDQYDQWRHFPALVAVCESRDLHHYALWMEDLGHTYPMGIDLAGGGDRTALVKLFFDQHLHPATQPQPLAVLAVTPAEDNPTVDHRGMSRFIMVDDDALPPDMHGLPAEKPITVVFARKIDLATVTPATLSLRQRAGGALVEGEWTPSLQNSRFQFRPGHDLRPGTGYQVIIAPGIRDRLGLTLAAPVVRHFRTRER